jgi:hypothetical protein
VNSDVFLLEQIYLNKLRPSGNANNTEVHSQNIPDGAKAPIDYTSSSNEEISTPAEKQERERAGRIEKIDKTDLDKSQVYVFGFGVVTLGELKKNVSAKFEDLAKRINNNEPNFVYKRIKEKHGFLLHAVRALIEVERDIEKLRRAGKMPGMIKRYNFNS